METVRLAELMSVFSLAADAGMGMPLEAAQRTALLSVRLGEAAGLDEEERRDAYYIGLLRDVGCVADAHLASAFMGEALDFARHLEVSRQFSEAFADPRIVIEEMVGEDDRVYSRGHFEGRHQGTFMGIPATGRPVRVPVIGFHRFEGGRVVEHRGEMAAMALMAQLGVGAGPAA